MYAALSTHPTSPIVQFEACGALGKLLHVTSDDNKVLTVSSGGLGHVYAAMEAHPTTAVVQVLACEAIWNLATVDDNKAAIVSSGGLDRVYAAMRAHPTDSDLQRMGLVVLVYLSKLASNLRIMKADGKALACVRQYVAIHPPSCLGCEYISDAQELLARLG